MRAVAAGLARVRKTAQDKPAPRAPPPSLKAKLAKLGIHREFDLVLHLPLRYEDETRLIPIAEAHEGAPVQVEGTVIDSHVAYRPRRQLICKIEDESGLLYTRAVMRVWTSAALSMTFGVRSGMCE